MLVLLAAATIAAAPPLPTAERMPNFYRQPARCGALHDEVTRRIRTAERGRANLWQYAVLRQVDGCGVPAPAGYHPDYLLPGRADAPQYRPVDDKADEKR